MLSPKSPFTREQLLPQEETLEISRQKGELYIGIPKEAYFQEKRICLTPDAVNAIVNNGHRVLIEKGAPLSHSVILLREFGIPTIINIKGLTKTLKSGDRITIDGSEGSIKMENG